MSSTADRLLYFPMCRYMDAYREKNGQYLTVQEVERAVKKFKSHRTIPPWMNRDE